MELFLSLFSESACYYRFSTGEMELFLSQTPGENTTFTEEKIGCLHSVDLP